jgi:type II secretory pathway pseudopilin PulG
MTSTADSKIRRRFAAQDGFALVLALAILVVFGIATTSVIEFTVLNQHASRHSNAETSALSLAVAGIDNAVSQLQKAAETCGTSCVTNAAWAPFTTGTTVGYENGGSVTYTGTLSPGTVLSSTRLWHLTSTGKVRNPLRSGQYVTKKVQADVQLAANFQQTVTTDSWQYIYSKRTGTPGGCDESVYNNTNVQSSMYVAGNLCLNTPSSIIGPQSGSDPPVKLIVKGTVNLDVNTNVGTSAKPLSAVHIAGGCKNAGVLDLAPPAMAWPLCRSPYDKVYNSDTSVYNPNPNKQSDTATPTVSAPTADFVDWYLEASPGPLNPCQVTTGTPPTFDTDLVNNYATGGSILTVVTLTPVSAYDCWTDRGELAWLPANTDPAATFPKGSPGLLTRQAYGQLYFTGTAYIDGSAVVDASPVQFRGNGALYVSGTFLVKNAIFCAMLASNLKSCDTNGWEAAPNPDIFVAVANGNGSAGGAQGQVAAGDSVEYKSAAGQGALYATNAVEIDTTSQFQGPMIAQTEVISQTGGSPFPIFLNVPFGTPGNGITSYSVAKVFNYRR